MISFFVLQSCLNTTHIPGFSPVNQSCLSCSDVAQIPVQFACGCPKQQVFTTTGAFTCQVDGCIANQPFEGITVCGSATNFQTTCPPGQTAGFTSGAFHCGSLRYSPSSNEDSAIGVTLCKAGTRWIPEFQVCWPEATLNTTQIALLLCPLNYSTDDAIAASNGLACQYLMNLCAEDNNVCNRSDLYRDANVTDALYLPRVKDYAYRPFDPAAPKTQGNENYANLTFTLSRKSGQILMKSKLAYESLDFCSITEVGINPIYQRIHRFAHASQRDRTWNIGLLTRMKMHQKSEMIRRNADEHLTLLGDYDFKIGQTYRKQCRIGHKTLQQFAYLYADDPLYVTFYLGDYSTTQTSSGTKTSERIVPISYQGQNYLSFPLWRANGTGLILVNQIQYIQILQRGFTSQTPQIWMDTVEVPRLNSNADIIDSPLLNRVVTKLTSIGRGSMLYADERNYVEFNYASYFDNQDSVKDMTTRTAIMLVLIWFCYLLYGISQMKKLLGLNKTCQNASAKVLSYLLTIMLLGVGSAFLLDLALSGILQVDSPLNYLADGLARKTVVQTSILVGCIIFIVIEVLQQTFSLPGLRFVVLDHGDPAFYYRRYYIVNALSKLIQKRHFPLLFAYGLAAFLLYALDLQYADGALSYASLTPHASEVGQRIGIFSLVLILSHLSCAAIAQILRFFQRASAFDRFIDVLPLAGCSLLVFDSPFSAFFLYGAPIFGDADISGAQITRNLLDEAQSLAPRRGMNGRSAQSFRVYFNESSAELALLYQTAEQMVEFNREVEGRCGKAEFPNAQTLRNNRFSLRIDYFAPTVPDALVQQQQLVGPVVQLIQAQPVKYTLKLARIFDFNIGQQTADVMVVSDPTRNFSPRALDLGNMLPGGLGGAAWLSKAFWYSHWWLDTLFGVAVMNIVGFVTGNMAAGIVVAWALTELWGRVCMLSMRKQLGLGTGCCEGLMM